MAVKESYVEMAHVEEANNEGEEYAVLRAAKQKRPELNWKETVDEENTLKPFNDFIEEKQEGWNSFEERQARSAAIQAKLQAARSIGSWGAYQQGSLLRASGQARAHRETR